jgi:DNA-binding Lrp family transcriptional regulator
MRNSIPHMRQFQKLESSGYIKRRVALLDAEKLNLGVSVFIAVRTNQHIVNAQAVPRCFDCPDDAAARKEEADSWPRWSWSAVSCI